MQHASGIDVTDDMIAFADSFLNTINEVDGFILKSRSPSCGIKDVKVYTSMDKGSSIKKLMDFLDMRYLSDFQISPSKMKEG